MSTLQQLKLELLTVSRMYDYMPMYPVDCFCVGLISEDVVDYFIKNIYNAIYNRMSPQVDSLLDEIVDVLMTNKA
jgi:hypothetical protein